MLKNPIVLMMLASGIMMFGLPKLMVCLPCTPLFSLLLSLSLAISISASTSYSLPLFLLLSFVFLQAQPTDGLL